jgi:hypothetical protein
MQFLDSYIPYISNLAASNISIWMSSRLWKNCAAARYRHDSMLFSMACSKQAPYVEICRQTSNILRSESGCFF